MTIGTAIVARMNVRGTTGTLVRTPLNPRFRTVSVGKTASQIGVPPGQRTSKAGSLVGGS